MRLTMDRRLVPGLLAAALILAVSSRVPSAHANNEPPAILETWEAFDGLVAAHFDDLTNKAAIYPPGTGRFTAGCGLYRFSETGSLAAITNLMTETSWFGVPVWRVGVVETAAVNRVWLYAGGGGMPFRTNTAPSSLDAEQWVRNVYGAGPPPYLPTEEAAGWYRDRDRSRIGLDVALVRSGDWAALRAGMAAAATNNPPPGSPPLVLPEETNRVAFAAVQASSNGLSLSVYTPVDKLPVDLLTRPTLAEAATNSWLILSTFTPSEPFDSWSGPYLGSMGFFLAARTDIDGDGDGISDCRETYVLGTRPDAWDSAGLAIGDFARMYVYGLAPLLRDTNGDGMDDDEAILRGMNPVTQTNAVGASEIRYLHDEDDRLTGVFTTTAESKGGGAALYTVSPAHNLTAAGERRGE